MAFIRVVEVFPPLFPPHPLSGEKIPVQEGVGRFMEEARIIGKVADMILIADVKNPKVLEVSPLEAAIMLRERLGIDAAPVIVLRDVNRRRFLSSVLTGISMGLKSMAIVWGDRRPSSAGSSNVRDYSSLAGALKQASLLRKRARSNIMFLAPVDIRRLAHPEGVAMAKERLRAGASFLLAQPPTGDAYATFNRHIELLEAAGLREHVLLNVFPFRDGNDVKECERNFGWRLPRSVHTGAARGPSALFEMERKVVERLREEGLPGVYLNARGNPGTVKKLLA